MSILLDTNILVDCLRGHAPALAWYRALAGRPSVCVVTLTELQAGARSQREQRDVAALRDRMIRLEIDEDIADRGGVLLRHYGPSHGMDIPDALIAATAEQHGLRLATLNVKHFPMLKGLKRPY